MIQSTSGVPVDFRSKRILIVEDEALVALLVEDELLDVGATVLGPVASVEQALELLDQAAADDGIDAAVLDMNLGGDSVAPVADALARRAVPFLFMTGYGDEVTQPGHAGAPTIHKPFATRELVVALDTLMRPGYRLAG